MESDIDPLELDKLITDPDQLDLLYQPYTDSELAVITTVLAEYKITNPLGYCALIGVEPYGLSREEIAIGVGRSVTEVNALRTEALQFIRPLLPNQRV
jgi:hypothetical protein